MVEFKTPEETQSIAPTAPLANNYVLDNMISSLTVRRLGGPRLALPQQRLPTYRSKPALVA